VWADFGQCGGRLSVSDFGGAIKNGGELPGFHFYTKPLAN